MPVGMWRAQPVLSWWQGDVLAWLLPEAESDTRIWVQVAFLRGDYKEQLREWGNETKMGRQPNKGTSSSKWPLWKNSPGMLGASVECGPWCYPAQGETELECLPTTSHGWSRAFSHWLLEASVGTVGTGGFSSQRQLLGQASQVLTGSWSWAGTYDNGECLEDMARALTASMAVHPLKRHLGSEDLRVMVIHEHMPLAKQEGVGGREEKERLKL